MPTVLESLLHPISRMEFREHYYGKRPLLVRGTPDKFAGLLTWDDLNRVLNSAPDPLKDVEISSPGKMIRPAPLSAIVDACRAGASILVHHLQHSERKVAELSRALAAEIGEPTDVSLFLSQPSQSALEKHYDRHDVFVLQLDGRKAWWVYDPTFDKPYIGKADRSGESPGEPTLECELAPGDVLYVPRGHWHHALAQGGLSLHLTLAVDARSGMDFLNWLVDELRNDVRFRHEMPLSFTDEPAEVREERVRQHVAGLGELLVSRFRDRETVRSFIDHCVLSERDSRRFKFPAQLLASPVTQLNVRQFSRPARQRFVLEEALNDDLFALHVWGHTFQFPKSARPLIDFILSRTAFGYEDALAHAGELTEQGVRDVLDPLLREGILDAAD